MRHLLHASLCIAAIASPAEAQSAGRNGRSPAPMDALAETILTLSPASGAQGTPTLSALQGARSPIRWRSAPNSGGEAGNTIGTLAGGAVRVSGAAAAPALTFEWDGRPGQPFGFDPVAAFRKRGFDVRALYCASMMSEGTNVFLVSAPGKRPGILSVYAFDAPMAISSVHWSIGYRFDGHVPTLEEAQADADLDISEDCSTQTFGPVPQISYAAAVAWMRKRR